MRQTKETFDEWVSRNSGEVLTPLQEYELHRYVAWRKTHVVYHGKKRRTSFSDHLAESHYHAWQKGESVRLNDRTDAYMNGSPVVKALMKRDGPRCFFCNEEFSDKLKPTIEHLVSRVHKGPDHMSNKYLACKNCNEKAGHLSAPEKIRFRDSMLWQ